MTERILIVALATPLHKTFDYLPPDDQAIEIRQPGTRLLVPFGRRVMTGILVRVKRSSDLEPGQLRRALQWLDDQPLLDEQMLALIHWAAHYYLAPEGEALFHALPPQLRRTGNGKKVEATWQISPLGQGVSDQAFSRAPRQQQAWHVLLAHQCIASSDLNALGVSKSALAALVSKGVATKGQAPISSSHECEATAADPVLVAEGPPLHPEQRTAVDAITSSQGRFQPFLLEGVTGSGKTEVYLQAIGQVLQQGQQALVLVPEIGLTPQTIDRFKQRFGSRVVAMHSNLSDNERLSAWRAARCGDAAVVIGTRSAIFTAFSSLGLIVVDEEHDNSYKQQSGFRYSARDLAIKRAQLTDIPIVLGSATPALESLHNALCGRYQLLTLHQRAGGARAPSFELVDARSQTMDEGFCPQTLDALRHTIKQGNQALVFINRRGFAPTLICHDCGWVAECHHCDARLVIYLRQQQLKCHHCDIRHSLPAQCPQCAGRQLQALGQGTERSETALQQRFPNTPVLRIDRDTTRNKGSLNQLFEHIHSGQPALLVGTQMLAKGHHFPDVTLVAILDADAGLCSADFRGPERTAQMLTQVAGRAGRADKPGAVMVQTHQPEHPLLQLLARGQYRQLSEQLLAQRQALGMPPFGHLAVIRCSGNDPARPEQLLLQLRNHLSDSNTGLTTIGPLAPAIAKLAGRYRCQLLLKHLHRNPLHQALRQAIGWLQNSAEARRLRWSIDVDPQDFL